MGHKRTLLVDNFIGTVEQRCGYAQPQHPSGLRVDDQLDLASLHDWQLPRLRAFENTARIDTRLTKCVHDVGSIAHQSSDLGILAPCVDRRQMVERCQLSQLDSSAIKKWSDSYEDSIRSLATHCCESGVDLGAGIGIVHLDLLSHRTG